MNIAEFSEHLDLDTETGVEVLELFYDTTQVDLRRMGAAIDNNSPQLLMEAAHSIKGAARNLRFDALADIAKDLETMGRSGNVTGAGDLQLSISANVERIGRALKEKNTDDIGV